MHNLIQEIITTGPVVTDGGWGTELQERGLGIGEFPDAWNLSHPTRVTQVARAYVEAGSRIILTNTFGANRIRLADAELADKAVELNRAGVEISRRAAGERALVFASMGPTGKLIMNGDISADEAHSAFDEQAQSLAAAGADGLVIETMMDVEEAALAVAAAHKTGLPVVACMVFDSGKNQDQTMMGNTIEDATRALVAAGADVIGANCGQGIDGFTAICRRLRAATDLPIWLKPNAGLPKIVAGVAEYNATPDHFSAFVPELVAVGANFLGGCCGTGPAFISAIRARLNLQPLAEPSMSKPLSNPLSNP